MKNLKEMIFDPVIAMAKEKASTWPGRRHRECSLFDNVTQSLPNSPVNVEGQEKWADAVGGCVTGVRDDKNSFGITFRFRENSTIANRMSSAVDGHKWNDSLYAAHSELCGLNAFHPLVLPKNLSNYQYISDASSTAADDGEEHLTTLEDNTTKLQPSRCDSNDKKTQHIQDTVDSDGGFNKAAVRKPSKKKLVLERPLEPVTHTLPPCKSFQHDCGFTAAALPALPKLTYLDLDLECKKAKQSDLRFEARAQEKTYQDIVKKFRKGYEEAKAHPVRKPEPVMPNYADEYTYTYGTGYLKVPPPRDPTPRSPEKEVDGWAVGLIGKWCSYGDELYPKGKTSAGYDKRWVLNRGQAPKRGNTKDLSWRRYPNASGVDIDDPRGFMKPEEIKRAFVERQRMKGEVVRGEIIVAKRPGTEFPVVYTQEQIQKLAEVAGITNSSSSGSQATAEPTSFERRQVGSIRKFVSPKSALSSSVEQAKSKPDFSYVPKPAPIVRPAVNDRYDVEDIPWFAGRHATQTATQSIPHETNVRKRAVAPKGYEVTHGEPEDQAIASSGHNMATSGKEIAKMGNTPPIKILGKSLSRKGANVFEAQDAYAITFSGSFKKPSTIATNPARRAAPYKKVISKKLSVSKGKATHRRKSSDPKKTVQIPVTIVEAAEANDEAKRNPAWMLELNGYAC